MEQIVKLNKWANAHTNIGIDIARVILGLFLIFKGVFFAQQGVYLQEVAQPFGIEKWSFFTVHFIPMVHIAGGFLITIGLLTRLATAIHIPILLGAVIVNFMGAMDALNLVQALASFVLCAFFLVYGSGKHSADYYMKMNA